MRTDRDIRWETEEWKDEGNCEEEGAYLVLVVLEMGIFSAVKVTEVHV